MIHVYRTVLVLHVLAMAIWFGHKILVPWDLMSSLDAGGERTTGLIERVSRAQKLGIASGLVTLISGLTLVMLAGGFSVAHVRIHISLGLVIAMFVVGATLARSGWQACEAGIQERNDAAAKRGARRLIGAIAIEQVLWFVVMILMLQK